MAYKLVAAKKAKIASHVFGEILITKTICDGVLALARRGVGGTLPLHVIGTITVFGTFIAGNVAIHVNFVVAGLTYTTRYVGHTTHTQRGTVHGTRHI
tara:strand:- start:8426 stop:8719 length:294 start_codon:yes stop_codon:yes gene_type:complete